MMPNQFISNINKQIQICLHWLQGLSVLLLHSWEVKPFMKLAWVSCVAARKHTHTRTILLHSVNSDRGYYRAFHFGTNIATPFLFLPKFLLHLSPSFFSVEFSSPNVFSQPAECRVEFWLLVWNCLPTAPRSHLNLTPLPYLNLW